VLAAAQTPSKGTNELYRMFGVEVDRYGYPVENQPRLFRPTESLVDRVFVVGASSGPKVVQQATEQGSAAAMRGLPTLLTGIVEPNRYASRVNPDRCIKCRTCETICPHGAIRMTEEGAVSDPAFCQSCGFCAAACPVHAAELTNFTDEQMLAQARVAFSNLPARSPRILALLCYWCAYSAADFAGIERTEAPINYRAVRIRCSSSVNTSLLMQMFKIGVDGIIVGGCPERSCHHLYGNFVADKRIELARALMGQLGLEASRLRFEYIGAPMQAKLVETIRQMDSKLRELGPNPVARAYI
jgi:heterodisulfide reductase subunit A